MAGDANPVVPAKPVKRGWMFWKRKAKASKPVQSNKSPATQTQQSAIDRRRLVLRLWKLERENVSVYMLGEDTFTDRICNYIFRWKKVSDEQMRDYKASLKSRVNHESIGWFDLVEDNNPSS